MSQYLQNIVSHRVCAKINEHKGSQEVAIDPATAVLIGKILIKAVVLIKNCKKSTSEREDAIRNPSLLDLGGLKKIVRKELGWFRYLFLGAKIMRALREVGADMDHGELKTCGVFGPPTHPDSDTPRDSDDPGYFSNYVEL